MFIFFFSSRRRHTRYWRDWSSDVCSSDRAEVAAEALGRGVFQAVGDVGHREPARLEPRGRVQQPDGGEVVLGRRGDRKSVVEGKGVGLGSSRIIKKKKRPHSMYEHRHMIS